MVDDLLDVSRITSHRLELRKRPVDLCQLIEQAVELTRPLLDQRSVELRSSVGPGFVVDGDPDRLTQVLGNLFHNAAKFGPPGGAVTVSATCVDSVVEIAVEDRGMGIEPSELATIFDLFTQGRRTRGTSGLGLGLAIVRNIVELHGGRIRAESDGLGAGARFVVGLPSSRPTCDEDDATAEERPASGQKVLVVDDNRDAADSLALLLRIAGHETLAVYDPVAAIELAPEFRPAVALLDVGLPVMDGRELGRRLVALPGLDRVQLIALTGFGQPSDRERTLQAGFVEHLVKPVDPDRLDGLIRGLFA
jgi:CheY-like chemotaxis protein/two-component sensor histidine kinase